MSLAKFNICAQTTLKATFKDRQVLLWITLELTYILTYSYVRTYKSSSREDILHQNFFNKKSQIIIQVHVLNFFYLAKIQKKTRDTAKKTCSKRQKVNKALNQKMTVRKVVRKSKHSNLISKYLRGTLHFRNNIG